MKGEEEIVKFVFMGDSRIRNLYEYFQLKMDGSMSPSIEKPHHNLNGTYQNFNFKIDFLWAPQTETGNQYVCHIKYILKQQD